MLDALLALHDKIATSAVNFNLELLALTSNYPDLAALLQGRLQLLSSLWALFVAEATGAAGKTS